MHWIEEKRRARGWTQRQLANAAGCSPGLIDILENMHKGVTHPAIADEICRILEASAEQRDSIVPEIHRGKQWKRPDEDREQMECRNGLRREIVVINRRQEEIRRFGSIADAAKWANVTCTSVFLRCNKSLQSSGTAEEYKLCTGVTFRYADEWDEEKGE